LIIIGRLQDKKEQNSTVETEVPYKVETTPSPIIQQSEPLADTVTVTVSESVNTVNTVSIVTPPEPVKEEVVKSVAKKATPVKKTAKTTKETAKEPTPVPAKKAAKASVVKTESKVSTKRSSKKA
jgi:hypothetical protein